MATRIYHSNRKAHNWLVYRQLFKGLSNYRNLFRGIVVDLGCGESPYKEFILQTADRYIGVDWVGSFHKLKADIVADLNKPLPLECATADMIISISVLEHLSEPRMMLSEAHRILRPGGDLLLQVPWQWRIHEAPFDFFRYSPYGLKYLCEKAGFHEIEVVPMSGFFEMMALKFNYFSLRFIRGPRWLALPFRLALWPLWQVSQILGMTLSGIDKDHALESSGYFLVAKRKA